MAKKKIIKKLKNKYRFIIYNDGTFSEVFSLRLSLLNTYVIVFSVILIFAVLGALLVSSPAVQRVLPNTEYQVKSRLYKNALLIDSLQNTLRAQENQYGRIRLLLGGGEEELAGGNGTTALDLVKSNEEFKEINYVKSTEDSLLRARVEAEDRFNVTHAVSTQKENFLGLFLYPPINNGVIVASYDNTASQYFGVEIAIQKDTHVMAVAEGVIVSSNWSTERGYTIVIQHKDDLISCYKNTTQILKNTGEKVERGEAIAIVEKTMKSSSDSNLHFELWHKGKPLNPQDFISF